MKINWPWSCSELRTPSAFLRMSSTNSEQSLSILEGVPRGTQSENSASTCEWDMINTFLLLRNWENQSWGNLSCTDISTCIEPTSSVEFKSNFMLWTYDCKSRAFSRKSICWRSAKVSFRSDIGSSAARKRSYRTSIKPASVSRATPDAFRFLIWVVSAREKLGQKWCAA